MEKAIEYFFSAHSGFAYIGSSRLMEIAKAASCKIVFKPIDLELVLRGSGASPFGSRSKARSDYFFRREFERWSEERDVEFLGSCDPTYHGNDITLANCMIVAGINEGIDVSSLTHGLLEAHWRDDADLADYGTLLRLTEDLDIDGEALLAAANTEQTTSIYHANTEEAINRHVFGSPTYFVNGDMFYGQDRLEMVERAVQKSYSGKKEISG